MRIAVLALVVIFVMGLGCAVRKERIGSERLLTLPVSWAPGEVSAEQVSRDLGPPDEIHLHGDSLRFVYRSERRLQTSFILSYVLRLFTRESRASEARTLIVSFDGSNQLTDYALLAPLVPSRSALE